MFRPNFSVFLVYYCVFIWMPKCRPNNKTTYLAERQHNKKNSQKDNYEPHSPYPPATFTLKKSMCSWTVSWFTTPGKPCATPHTTEPRQNKVSEIKLNYNKPKSH